MITNFKCPVTGDCWIWWNAPKCDRYRYCRSSATPGRNGADDLWNHL